MLKNKIDKMIMMTIIIIIMMMIMILMIFNRITIMIIIMTMRIIISTGKTRLMITIIMMILQVNSSSYLAEGGDLDQQPGTKEKPFEEEIELVWEKGGSALNFYTDAQVSLARTFCTVNPFRKH